MNSDVLCAPALRQASEGKRTQRTQAWRSNKDMAPRSEADESEGFRARLAREVEARILADMADVRDINRPGGWLMEVTTPGNPPRIRHYKALDQARATRLVSAGLGPNEICEPVRQLNMHEFTGDDMRPGDVKQHVYALRDRQLALLTQYFWIGPAH